MTARRPPGAREGVVLEAMKTSRHWAIRDWRGKVVAMACRKRTSLDFSEWPVAERVEDVTCRLCRSSPRVQELLAERAAQEEKRRIERHERAVQELIARHREEFDELVAAEEVLDALGGLS
jgi:hypothetical protein